MFIRRTFDEFLKLHSAAEPLAGARNWVIDWRWLSPAPDDEASESERLLIEWPAWARPKTPSRE
jgi:hypothetical protein